MRIAEHVGYVDADGKRHTATITKVPGTGKSGAKTLDLTYRQEGEVLTVLAVPHEKDREPDGAFWLEMGAKMPEPTEKPKVAKARKK